MGIACSCIQIFQEAAIPLKILAWLKLYDDPFINRLENGLIKNPSIAIVGDSAAFYIYDGEPKQTSVADLFADAFGEPVLNASHSGVVPRGYVDILSLLKKRNQHFQLLIIEINPVTILRPIDEAKYNEWVYKYQSQSNNPSIASVFFKTIFAKDKELSHRDPTFVNSIKNIYFTPELDTESSLYDNPDNSAIKPMLASIFQSAKAIANHVVFFITPIDFSTLQSLLGSNIVPIIKKRISAVKTACDELNLLCINNAFLVENSNIPFPSGHKQIGTVAHLPLDLRKQLVENTVHELNKHNLPPIYAEKK